jgi:hypothetical protein
MNDIKALKPIVLILGIFVVTIGLLSVMVALGWTNMITPPPENAADGLVDALQAHRYEGALNQLSQDLKQQTNPEDLQALVKAIEESSLKGIEDAQGIDAQESDQAATARVQVKFANLQEQTFSFPLHKENGIWKVASLAPLQNLAGLSPSP